jgi:uncharacterized linocin/CFP29 family protein
MMYDNVAEVGWTENQWNTVARTVEEEAQKARVGRRFLPTVGPLPPDVVAVPSLNLTFPNDPNQPPVAPGPPPTGFVPTLRLESDTDPSLFLATISVLVELPKHQLSEPDLSGALAMFRRAANYIARVEDAIIVHGQSGRNAPPASGLANIPAVYRVTGGGFRGGAVSGLIPTGSIPVAPGNLRGRRTVQIGLGMTGVDLINAVIQARIELEAAGQFGPFQCIFSPGLQKLATNPAASFVMPLDRILPHLEGGSIFTSSVVPDPPVPQPFPRFPLAAVVATNGSPLEVVVGSDICVKFLQTTLEPRWVFRISERVAFRIKEMQSIAIIYKV